MFIRRIVPFTMTSAVLALFATSAMCSAQESKTPAVPAGASVYSGLVYAHRAGVGDTRLDLYVPKGSKPKALIIWIHGGGWMTGTRKEWVHPMFFVNDGFAVASLDYRFSNHAIFPAQIQDCKAAVRFLREQAGKYGLDPKRFVAAGESAGGNLTSLLATTGDDSAYFEPGASKTSDAVEAAIDVCGPSDLTAIPADGAEGTASYYTVKLLGGAPGQHPDLARLASPVFHISAKTPPIFIMHAVGDPVCPVDQSKEFYAALQKQGISSTLTVLPDNAHVGAFFWTDAMHAKMLAFLQKTLALPAK